MTALMHYAEETVTLDRTRTYVQGPPLGHGKPDGFWVSVAGEDDWPSWCRSEHYASERLQVHHAVALMPDANVLRLEDPTQMREFHSQWAVQTEAERRHAYAEDRSNWPIDWAAVAQVRDRIRLGWRDGACMKRICALLLIAAVIFGMVAAFTLFNTVYLLALVCASCAVGVAGWKTRNQT